MQSNEKLPESERYELLTDDFQWKLIEIKKKGKKEKENKSNCGSALNQSRFDRSNSDRDTLRWKTRDIWLVINNRRFDPVHDV